jgi:hypothetical protein
MLVTSKVIQAAPAEGERLVVVPIRPGVGIKMYESEARRRGLWPPKEADAEAKARRPARNKARKPDLDKGE